MSDSTEMQVEVEKSAGKKRIIIDATMLSSLMACPCSFDFNHNHQLQLLTGKSNSLEVGSIVHKVLEVYYLNKIKGFSAAQCLAAGLTAGELYVRGCPICSKYKGEDKPPCGHQVNEYEGIKNTPIDSDSRFVGWRDALNTCEQYFEFYKNDYWVPLEVEVVKGKVLYEDDEISVLWKAKYDWIVDTNQGIFPSDHKTHKQRRDTLSLNNQFMGQCLLLDTRSVIINKIGFQKTLKPEEKFTRVLMSYSIDRLLEWQSEILPHYAYQLLAYHEAGFFPRDFTQCETKFGNCKYVPICESDPGMRVEVINMTYVKGNKWEPVSAED